MGWLGVKCIDISMKSLDVYEQMFTFAEYAVARSSRHDIFVCIVVNDRLLLISGFYLR